MERLSITGFQVCERDSKRLVDLGHTIQEKKPKVEELIPTPAKYSKMKEILQAEITSQENLK